MSHWKAAVEINPALVKFLITNQQGDDLFKARIPHRPQHPRALLTLLEGAALWSGRPIGAVIGVGAPSVHFCDVEDVLGESMFRESALVHLDFVEVRPRRKIRGLGDFRGLRLLQGGV
jgi:hypothetical protein